MHTNSIAPAVFGYGGDGRPYATIHLLARDGNYYPARMLADSGNDVTLINYETARMLGLNPRDGQHFQVEGVVPGVKSDFYLYQLPMKIGMYPPFMATIGVGNIGQNLLGRRDVFSKFDITYKGDRQVVFQCRSCAGGIR